MLSLRQANTLSVAVARTQFNAITMYNTRSFSSKSLQPKRDPNPGSESSGGVRVFVRKRRVKETVEANPLHEQKLSSLPDIEEFAYKKVDGSAGSSKNLFSDISFSCKMYVLFVQDYLPLCFLVNMSSFLLIL
nr:endonuclease III homolog 1, chloroplastic-like [Ziziphus jujuba var. spinosa]